MTFGDDSLIIIARSYQISEYGTYISISIVLEYNNWCGTQQILWGVQLEWINNLVVVYGWITVKYGNVEGEGAPHLRISLLRRPRSSFKYSAVFLTSSEILLGGQRLRRHFCGVHLHCSRGRERSPLDFLFANSTNLGTYHPTSVPLSTRENSVPGCNRMTQRE